MNKKAKFESGVSMTLGGEKICDIIGVEDDNLLHLDDLIPGREIADGIEIVDRIPHVIRMPSEQTVAFTATVTIETREAWRHFVELRYAAALNETDLIGGSSNGED